MSNLPTKRRVKPSSPAPRTTGLRDARRAFTRAHICSAAREVFAERGFADATVEQIAQAAGTQRSTLYYHFSDKDQILAAIAEEFGQGLIGLIAELPGPVPSRQEVDLWIRKVAAFTVAERTPTILLIHLSHMVDVPPAIEALGESLLKAFAERLPAFARALAPGPEQGLARVRASMVMQQQGWAYLHLIRPMKGLSSEDVLAVAAEHFERFAREGAQD